MSNELKIGDRVALRDVPVGATVSRLHTPPGNPVHSAWDGSVAIPGKGDEYAYIRQPCGVEGGWHPMSTVTIVSIPSAPPAPVRKGRVGMRVRAGAEGLPVTIVKERYPGGWDVRFDSTGSSGLVSDDDIGTIWIVDAPADTRAEAVQLRRDDRVSVTDLRVGDRVGNWDDVDNCPIRHWPDMTVTVVGDDWVSLQGDGEHVDWKAGIDARSTYTCRRIAAAPVATPEVVRPDFTATVLACAEQIQRNADRLPPGCAPARMTRGESERWSAAVSLRLAARAEERRNEVAVQPQWAGGDDVDA
jgi:hypothetical protein